MLPETLSLIIAVALGFGFLAYLQKNFSWRLSELLISVACGAAYLPLFTEVFDCAKLAASEPKLTFLLMLMGQVVSAGAMVAAIRWNSTNENLRGRFIHLALGHFFVLSLMCQCVAVAVIFNACICGVLGRGVIPVLGGIATAPLWFALKEIEKPKILQNQKDENLPIDSPSESAA
jgi:hypothetical protein